MYALYMILLTFDLSTPVKYEQLNLFEKANSCKEARNSLTLSAVNNEILSQTGWVIMGHLDANKELIFTEYPMPVRFGCVYVGNFD